MSNDFRGEVLAELTRNGLVESIHTGHLIMLNADGSVHKIKGSVEMPIFPRSSVKCMQASAMVRNGLKLEPRLLALVEASHSGAQMHQDGVLEILASVGLNESDLQCAFDKPLGDAERIAWGDKAATRLAMNCSGKHAGMLATCVANGWDIKTYLNADHPLQVAVLNEIESLVGAKVSNKTFDGCGAPLFAVTTRELATAIRNITISKDPVHIEVMNAARAHPEMVAGEGRLTTRTMQSVPGLFMKEGAEAVEVASMADGRTLVYKISDGSWRAFGAIMHAALLEWGITTTEEAFNVYGGANIVGGMRAVL
ncbi:MAG: asparaginase [Candidatus Nanopelagicaceae bacterium]